MKGGSLTRFRPDPTFSQSGEGILGDLVKSTLRGGYEGFKSGHGVTDRIRKTGRGMKRGLKRGVKRKAEEAATRIVKKKLTDIFGE